MKKVFPVIILLITFSLIGIIVIQLLWLQNMILLKQEQVKEKIEKAIGKVGVELGEFKGSYTGINRLGTNPVFNEEFPIDFLRPITIGQRFSSAELNEKIQQAFNSVGLEKIRFEFLLMTVDARTSLPAVAERQSKYYKDEFEDSVNNFGRTIPLFAPSGSAAENLAADELLSIVALDYKKVAIKFLRLPILLAIIFTIIIISSFYLTIRTMLRQKKLGEIKNDFINNMTHEFKTPIATISLAVDALKNKKVQQDLEKINYFSAIIKEENLRMNRQVETILKASQLERQEVELNLKPVHVHETIQYVVDNFILQLEEKQGAVELQLKAENDLLQVDEVHFSNLINNLVDNAVKYAKTNVPLQVKISTQLTAKSFEIRVEDNGIGMSKETLKRVFERFYRAHTGNLHNVKGFGLGLSYVKTIADAHGGTIKVESTMGKGSTFILHLPLPVKTA